MDFAPKKQRSNGQKVLFLTVLGIFAIVLIWQFGLAGILGKKNDNSQVKSTQSDQSNTEQLSPQDINVIAGMVSTQGKYMLETENKIKVTSLKIMNSPTLSGPTAYAPLEVWVEKEEKPQRFVAMMGREGNNTWRIVNIKKVE